MCVIKGWLCMAIVAFGGFSRQARHFAYAAGERVRRSLGGVVRTEVEVGLGLVLISVLAE